MYFEKKKRTLDVTDLVALSNRPQAVSGGFPYFVCGVAPELHDQV